MGKLHLHVVSYLVAYRTVDEDVQVKVLVDKRVVPSEREVGQRRTDVGLVILVDDAIAIDILVFDITYVSGVLWIILSRISAP